MMKKYDVKPKVQVAMTDIHNVKFNPSKNLNTAILSFKKPKGE